MKQRNGSAGKVVARAMSLALVAALLPLAGTGSAQALGGQTDPNSWAPAGTTNVAPTATVTANAYEDGHSPDKLVDLSTARTNMWSDGVWDPEAKAWAKLTFPEDAAGISRIVLFPRDDIFGAYFPARYLVSLLNEQGDVVWSHTVVHYNPSGLSSTVIKTPDVIDLLAPVSARAVQIDVIERHAREGYGMQISEVAVFAGAPSTAESPNLALKALVSSSSSYEKPNEEHAMAYVHDGVADIDNWSSSPYDKVQDPATPAWLAYDLGCAANVDKVVVYPRVVLPNEKFFPSAYHLQSSDDGDTWVDVPGSFKTDIPNTVEAPQVFVPEQPFQARHVRLYVDRRGEPSLGGDGYLVQIAEFAVHGNNAGACVSKDKPALLFNRLADSDATWFTASDPLTFSSTDEKVATVDANGVIKAVGNGTAVVSAAPAGDPGNTVFSIDVAVDTSAKRIGEDFLIGGFYSPRPEYVNDVQFGYMADFGLDMLMGVQGNSYIQTVQGNYDHAMLAAENGIWYMPSSEGRLGCGGTAGKSAAEIREVVSDYTHVPGVAGFLLCDEGMPPTQWAMAFNTMRDVAPDLYPHFNFCPWGACGVNETSVRSWLDATGGVRSDWAAPDYLMFDMYPLKASIEFNGWFNNLEQVRKLGLEYQIKTATYLQSVGYAAGPVPTRIPSSPEIAWQANTALAYGYKQLTYFTYWQPSCDEYCAESFTEGIMKADGTKSDRFDDLKQLNSEIHALSSTLMRLDAKDVYFNGSARGQRPAPRTLAAPNTDGSLPADTFVARADGSQNLLLSYLVDRETGEHYLFVVNNNFDGTNPIATDVTLTFDNRVRALEQVSRSNGARSAAVSLRGHALSLNLAGGEGRLYRLVIKGEEGKVR